VVAVGEGPTGMKEKREFNIVVVSEDAGTGIQNGEGKIIRYSKDFMLVKIDGR
jgi:hypothetical protein